MPSQQSLEFRSNIVAGAVVGIAAMYFAWHGAWRALGRSTDFAVVYAASRAWIRGEDPYDKTTLERRWIEAGGDADRRSFERPSLYPPSTFLLMSPIAALSWRAATIAWLAVNVASLCWALALLRRELTSTRAVFFLIAVVLAWAPVHAAVSLGQLCLPPLAMILTADRRRQRLGDSVAGALLGLAVALKPQIGVFFWGFELYRLRFASFLTAAGVVVVTMAIGSGQLWRHDIAFVETLIETARNYSTTGPSSPRPENPFRHEMVNVQVVTHALIASSLWANAGALLAIAVILTVACPFRRSTNEPLFECSVVAVITLLAVYHRAYDAVLLAMPLTWALARLQGVGETRVIGPLAIVAVSIMFLPPGSAMLFEWVRSGRLPSDVAASAWWQAGAMLHQAWGVLIIAVGLAASRPSVKCRRD